MKVLALIFYSTTIIKGFAHFTKENTYESIGQFIASVIYLVISVMSYYWLLTEFLTFK